MHLDLKQLVRPGRKGYEEAATTGQKSGNIKMKKTVWFYLILGKQFEDGV
jgi:hypothetical protein